MLGLGLNLDTGALRASGAAGSSYAEVGVIGFTTDGGNNATNPSADAKWSSIITVPVGGVWAKNAYMSFFNGAAGVNMRPVLYTGSGVSSNPLFAQGQQLTCPSTFSNTLTELGPWNWVSGGAALFIPAGSYMMGMMFDASGMTLRNAGGSGLYGATDAYSDGAAATWGTVSGPFAAQVKMRIPYSLSGP